MPFDKTEFMKTKFEARIDSEKVPELKQWFDKNEKPIWKVRNLSGMELGLANLAAQRQNIDAAVLEGFLSGYGKQTKQAVQQLLGKDPDQIPEDVAKRIEHLKYGSVDPICDEDLAIKLCKEFPVVFLRVTNLISILSGMGALPGKSKPFGKTNASK